MLYSKLKDKFKELLGLDINYQIGSIFIDLPSRHLLPRYQLQNPKYDKFLPFLAEKLPSNTTFIDIGANCGDTIVSVVQKNPYLDFVCIEPDNTFYEYLTLNINKIKQKYPNALIRTFKHVISNNMEAVYLTGGLGTKKINRVSDHKKQENCFYPIKLDDLSNEIKSPISIIKSDVDGFDSEVILSSDALIDKFKPLIYFECQYQDLNQLSSFKNMIYQLYKKGYSNWYVFDNYGEFLVKVNDINTIFQLLQYVMTQNLFKSTRTIYYYDILVSTNDNNLDLDNAVKEYSTSI